MNNLVSYSQPLQEILKFRKDHPVTETEDTLANTESYRSTRQNSGHLLMMYPYGLVRYLSLPDE